MTVFMSLGVLALIFGIVLKAMDAKKHYGLELPNVRSAAETEAEEAEVVAAED